MDFENLMEFYPSSENINTHKNLYTILGNFPLRKELQVKKLMPTILLPTMILAHTFNFFSNYLLIWQVKRHTSLFLICIFRFLWNVNTFLKSWLVIYVFGTLLIQGFYIIQILTIKLRFVTQHYKWQPTPIFLPRETHGQDSLVGYSPSDRKESDTTERLTHNTRKANDKLETSSPRCSLLSIRFQWCMSPIFH